MSQEFGSFDIADFCFCRCFVYSLEAADCILEEGEKSARSQLINNQICVSHTHLVLVKQEFLSVKPQILLGISLLTQS